MDMIADLIVDSRVKMALHKVNSAKKLSIQINTEEH